MVNEGYLQIKIRELNDNLIDIEKKGQLLLNKISEKEIEVNKLLNKLPERIKDGNELTKSMEDFKIKLNKQSEEVKQFHINEYNKIFKNLSKDVNHTLEEIKDKINFTIADHTTHLIILEKYLLEKGILNPTELIDYVEKYHDEIMNDSLNKLEQPQKSLKIEVNRLK